MRRLCGIWVPMYRPKELNAPRGHRYGRGIEHAKVEWVSKLRVQTSQDELVENR